MIHVTVKLTDVAPESNLGELWRVGRDTCDWAYSSLNVKLADLKQQSWYQDILRP